MPTGVRTGQDFRGQGDHVPDGKTEAERRRDIEGSLPCSDSVLRACHMQSRREGRRPGGRTARGTDYLDAS